jgi:hypothetical protein
MPRVMCTCDRRGGGDTFNNGGLNMGLLTCSLGSLPVSCDNFSIENDGRHLGVLYGALARRVNMTSRKTV